MNSNTRAGQWRQLLAVTLAHAVADIYVGFITPLLVPMHERYGVSFGAMVFIAALLGFSANIFQVVIGSVRPTWTRPWLINAGLLLGGTAVLMPTLPVGGHSVVWMALLALIAGLGVATVHPEGLRAVHGLDKIPTSLATAVFMVAGFLGFASGALISALITDRWGLLALRWLFLLAPLAGLPLLASGLRLPPEGARAETSPARRESLPAMIFPLLFAIGTILTVSSQIQATLLPSYLHKEAGYSLSFSGLSFTLFGLGGAAGALLWGALAPRLGHLRILFYSSLAGAPLTLLYLWLAPRTAGAAMLLAFAGFIVYTGYPLTVALARNADSRLRPSQRMGLMSGGTWAIAAIALWCLGPLSALTGLRPILHLIWAGYLVAALLTLTQLRKKP